MAANTSISISVPALLLCVAAACGVADAQTFAGLGMLPGGTYSWGVCVSGDGSVVAGTSETADRGQRAVRWTRVGGAWQIEDLGTLPDGVNSFGGGINGDGSLVVGYDVYGDPYPTNNRGFRWTSASGMVGVDASPPGAQTVCYGVSMSGSTAVGTVDNVACTWTTNAGGGTDLLTLGVLAGDLWSMASATVPDGSVVIGQSSNQSGGRAFRWTSGAGMESLGLLPGGSWSTAVAVSDDGSVIVGTGDLPEEGANHHAFRWTSDVGMVQLEELPGRPGAIAMAVSSDGTIIAGQCLYLAAGTATLWSPALGIVDLNQYLPTLGVNLSGWTLYGVSSLSLDGHTLVGSGTHNGADEAWIATIPACGSADFDHDGAVGTDADIEAFFACIAGNCCPLCGTGDFNGDGDTATDADIEAFFRVLAGGSC